MFEALPPGWGAGGVVVGPRETLNPCRHLLVELRARAKMDIFIRLGKTIFWSSVFPMLYVLKPSGDQT